MRVLNIGCGIDENGTDFVDLYPQRDEVISYNADIDKLPFEDNTFDEVTNTYMLEHLKDRRLFLSEVNRVLKKGGKFKLETDNAGFILFHNCKSSLMTHYGGYTYHGDDDKHYSLFTTCHVDLLLSDHGFEGKSELFNRDKFSKTIEVFLAFFRMTRFKWITYAQIRIEATKL